MKIQFQVLTFATLFAWPVMAQSDRPVDFRAIANSFMAEHPDSITYQDESKSSRWNYEQGVMMEAFYQAWKQSGDIRYLSYARKNLDHYVEGDGSIRTYRVEEYNLDNLTPGKFLVRIAQRTNEKKYRRAIDTLMRQFADHPRTKEGGFWHKQIYPHQMWLDGLYMGQPFRAIYASVYGTPGMFDDIISQFLLIAGHTYDSATGLYFHGWDESRAQRWSHRVTGCSPNLWGRSIGWFAMALVEVLEFVPHSHPQRKELTKLFSRLCDRMLQQRDDSTSLWFQVVNRQNAPGNYREASVSSMFAYAFAKGARLGLLSPRFAVAGRESFNGILRHLVTTDDQGRILLHDVCRVSGLGGKPYRDGSYEYYISEPRRTNDFKGYGPFLLAAIEMDKQFSHRSRK